MSDIDGVVGSVARGESLGENRVEVGRGIELKGLSGIGNSDDPFPERQEPEDEPPANEPSTADHDTGSPGDWIVGPAVVGRDHIQHVFLRSLKRVKKGQGKKMARKL